MKSLCSKLFCILFIAGIANFSYSQTKSEGENYNLPPGYYLTPGKQVFDLSYKLEGKVLDKDIPDSELQVLKEISEEELLNMPAEYQQYVHSGKDFIDSLSAHVKSLYTEKELWYIFAFDRNLKNQLSLIQ